MAMTPMEKLFFITVFLRRFPHQLSHLCLLQQHHRQCVGLDPKTVVLKSWIQIPLAAVSLTTLALGAAEAAQAEPILATVTEDLLQATVERLLQAHTEHHLQLANQENATRKDPQELDSTLLDEAALNRNQLRLHHLIFPNQLTPMHSSHVQMREHRERPGVEDADSGNLYNGQFLGTSLMM
jgi:hypothetical protein